MRGLVCLGLKAYTEPQKSICFQVCICLIWVRLLADGGWLRFICFLFCLALFPLGWGSDCCFFSPPVGCAQSTENRSPAHVQLQAVVEKWLLLLSCLEGGCSIISYSLNLRLQVSIFRSERKKEEFEALSSHEDDRTLAVLPGMFS